MERNSPCLEGELAGLHDHSLADTEPFAAVLASVRHGRMGRAVAVIARSARLLHTIVASSAVSGAFPAQRIGIYRGGPSSVAHHHFVDDGVMNNRTVHIAIAAGATCCWRRPSYLDHSA